MSVPTADFQNLSPSAVVDLWVLDCTAIGGAIWYFHAGTNQLGTSVVWQGKTYTPMPVEINGLARTTRGALPRPTIRVANINGTVSSLISTLDDMVGATVIRKRTLVKYLDAVNFQSGNPTADPTAEFPDEVFVVEAKQTETVDFIEFELVSKLDFQGLCLPKRLIQATICPWVFKGTECGYGGADATCTKTLAACTAKFGSGVALPFGGFPAAARIR